MKNKNEKKGNSKKISMLTAAERRAKFEASNHFQQTVKPYQVMREHLGSIGGCRAFILAMQKDLPEDAPAKLPARAVRILKASKKPENYAILKKLVKPHPKSGKYNAYSIIVAVNSRKNVKQFEKFNFVGIR